MKRDSEVREHILRTPLSHLCMLLLASLMKTVKAEAAANPESVTLGQKIVKLFNHDITFLALGVLALVCFLTAFIVNTWGQDNNTFIALTSIGCLLISGLLVQAYRIGYLQSPFTGWHIAFIVFNALILFTVLGVMMNTGNLTASSMSDALKFFAVIVMSMLFLVASLICGYWVSLYNRPFCTCQIICIVFAILTLLSTLGMIGVLILIYHKYGSSSSSRVGDGEYEVGALQRLMKLAYPLITGFILSSYYLTLLDLPYSRCEIICLLLISTIYSFLIGGLFIVHTANGWSSYLVIPIDLILTSLLLWLLHHYQPFSKYYTPYEIAFVVIGIMIFICALVVIKIDNIQVESYEVEVPVYFLVAYAFCLVVPFAYYAYRLGLLDSIMALLKRSPRADKTNVHNLVGNVSEAVPNAMAADT
ncbi:uncharacterized protein BXIN_0653 [Babesia sp. Xinjiang]|uniref:uncharacterized protein n=1 Tax=Babesia sp. Xinjiang TaxID=462227 RepID=UPI000A235162|nr:uncharacterized protein BXIN_0653 [Babesia sp. Xinjiang]ORM41772.1 hypothetical protein BXIN_0653 [Babesia sp. Xinjiang]